ncbi:hypothetical protein H2248_006845 [Termitomyces sp. 'cryptogamus']|nr:hypothetical protein H2248_006845 [Termitomyces sp. 'cryptogamus']
MSLRCVKQFKVLVSSHLDYVIGPAGGLANATTYDLLDRHIRQNVDSPTHPVGMAAVSAKNASFQVVHPVLRSRIYLHHRWHTHVPVYNRRSENWQLRWRTDINDAPPDTTNPRIWVLMNMFFDLIVSYTVSGSTSRYDCYLIALTNMYNAGMQWYTA